jgi:hypothetical protein
MSVITIKNQMGTLGGKLLKQLSLLFRYPTVMRL